MKIRINRKISISNKNPPLVIAEISGNHCGKKSLFLKHIVSAAKNGADLIKIQTYEPKDITLKNKNYKIKSGIWKSLNLWSIYKKACTPFSWHKEAFMLAKKIGTPIFSTPFSIRAVNLLEKLKNPIYKISSFEITDYKLIKYIAAKKKPIIISTGNSEINEIKKAVKIINKYHNKLIILHCVSDYPTLEKNSQIIKINYLKKIFKKNLIGLSDHTNDIVSSLSATALGAVVIEKHYKINHKIKSPDSKFSITPDQLKKLKKLTYRIHETLGKKITEKKVRKETIFFRRSIFASRHLKKGIRIKEKDLNVLRPKIGIGAEKIFKIIGKKLKRNIKRDAPIFHKDLL